MVRLQYYWRGTEIAKSSAMKNVTGSIHSISYLFLHGGALHYIYYITNEKDFKNYLPEFEQIVKTFRFIK
jgi:hypothetical protein